MENSQIEEPISYSDEFAAHMYSGDEDNGDDVTSGTMEGDRDGEECPECGQMQPCECCSFCGHADCICDDDRNEYDQAAGI